ncbi:conserved Plasmodium protein, unknown function [Plasmodium ovale]|uniref:Chloroquine resistance marker protein n=1 Tax=Plasmodium ovale TaxID=36330 RepID=A0A1D3TKC2_PLAOA|nr:conserved Plasmodium protein, unknown function [Plasmodium ovale]
MIQKFILDILNKILGNFIYGLNDEQFCLSDLLSGKLELTNIHFKQSIIDLIDIPCRLNFGCVGYFKINLPIFYFMKNPINVYIEDVIIVLSTIPSKYLDDKLYKDKYIENKKNYLLSSEYRAIVCSIEGGVIWQMILSLINNINISIKNVHIRIEDFTSNPSNCFSFGISVEELFLSLPKEGLPFKRDGYYTKKNELVNNTMINMITVKRLGVYMDYLDMKKLMSRKQYTEWNDLIINNDDTNDVSCEGNNLAIRKKKNKKRCKQKLHHRKRKNIKTNEENLNDFQNIIKNIKDNFFETRRNQLDIKNMSKINMKIRELNGKILNINRNSSKKTGDEQNREDNSADKNNNAVNAENKKDEKCSLSISNFYNFNLFSKKEEKIVPVMHDLHIDNDVSWIACITKFADSIENSVLKEKKEELIKKKRKRKRNLLDKNKKSKKENNTNSDNIEKEEDNNYKNNVNQIRSNTSLEKNKNAKNEDTNYINKAVSFFSLNSITSVINKKFQNRHNGRETLDEIGNKKEQTLSDGYFTTKENISEFDLRNKTHLCIYKKERKKKMKNFVFLENKNECGEKYYDVIDDYKKISENMHNTHLVKKDDKIYLNFLSDTEKKRVKKRNKIKCAHQTHRHHSVGNSYKPGIELEDKKKGKIIEESRFMKYIKKNEIKEKIRKRKRRKIHSVYLMYEKTYKINKTKLNTFFFFLQLIKNIKHEYIINPNFFEGYGEIYLSLIPTDHGQLPFSRCFSSWGIQKRSEKEFEECLPKLSVFVTLKNIKIIFSDKQILNIVKWVNLNFFTYYIWKAGILSQFEKAKANNEEEIAYINKWVLKLLDTHSSKEEKEEAEKYCEEFENNHSINIINLLRSRAFCKLQELRKEVELKKNSSGTDGRTMENIITSADQKEFNDMLQNDHKDNELKQVANESIHVLKNLMKNQKAYNKIKNSFREKIFTIDICIDICIINSTFLLTIESCTKANAGKVNFVKTYAVLMQCIHYHNQISNTHELKNSMDIEMYPLTVLLLIKNLDNKYIKPEINVLYILTNAEKKNAYENYHKKFLFNVENFEFIKKYNILKRKRENMHHIKSREQSDTLNFGNLRQKLKFLVEDNFFFFPKRENNIYCNELNDIILSDPSLYLRYDNQSYTILEKPDHRLFLHNCAYSIFNINGEIVNSFIDDYFHFTDERAVLSKKKKSAVSFKKKEYFLELGAKYCNDILDNYTTHTNVFVDVQLEKILSFVITKSGKNSEIQGYSLNLNPVKIVSQLTQRFASYEESITKSNLYDSFFVQFDGIQLKRVLNWENAAKSYKTYLDNNFIKPYHKIFHSKNKMFFLSKKDVTENFSFNLKNSKRKDCSNEEEKKTEEGVTNRKRISSANSYGDGYRNSYTKDLTYCQEAHAEDPHSSNDGNKSEIFNLKMNKINYLREGSSDEYNNVEKEKVHHLRSSSCPDNKKSKVVLVPKKGASYDAHKCKEKTSVKDKKYGLFFFQSCAKDFKEEEEEIVKDSNIYKKYENSWKTITNTCSRNDSMYDNDNLNNSTQNSNNSNYVLSMSEKASCTIHLCHIKFNPAYPMFIIKLNEENLYINICDYDIEFFFTIFSYMYEHYNIQELECRKRNILFLKRKIKSLSKLTNKQYKNALDIHNDNPKLLKKKASHRKKKKSTRGNTTDSTNGKIVKVKNISMTDRCNLLNSNAMKQKRVSKNEENNEELLYQISPKKSSLYDLQQNESRQLADLIRNVKKGDVSKGKYHACRKNTFVAYLSDSNFRTTQELSISEFQKEFMTNVHKVSIISKHGLHNGNITNNTHMKENCHDNKNENTKDAYKVNTNESNVHQIYRNAILPCALEENERGNISNSNVNNFLNRGDYSDSHLLNDRRATVLRESYYSNDASTISYSVRDNMHEDVRQKCGEKKQIVKIKKKKKKKKLKRKEKGKGRVEAHPPAHTSSDDDSWDDLLENYDTDESLDDNEKTKVQDMLLDIENIKKRLSSNNFIITCSFSLSIQKILIRLWKRKSPLKRQNKSNGLKSFNSFQLAEKYPYFEKKGTEELHDSTNSEREEYNIGKEDNYNFTSVLREHEINKFPNNDVNNIEIGEDDNFFCNNNFITLNECLQTNVFNNMQYVIPLYTFIFSEIFFVAKVEKNNCAYVLYSMNNIDIRDESNIALLSMSSIYHSDSKFIEKGMFSNCNKSMDIDKLDKKKKKERKKKDDFNFGKKENSNMIETDDTFLDYSICNIDLPDLEKTHLVLLYFGSLFKNNHTFKFILNRTKIKIFWEIVDECMSWVLNINELLPKMHTIEEEIIHKLNDSEDKHLYYLQKMQKINYDILYTKRNNNSSILSKRGYKVAIYSLVNDYNLKFENCVEESNQYYDKEGSCNEEITDYTEMEDGQSDDFFLFTNEKLLCDNPNGVIFMSCEMDMYNTMREILYHENYFFNYIFNKVNKEEDINTILWGINLKDDKNDCRINMHKGGKKLHLKKEISHLSSDSTVKTKIQEELKGINNNLDDFSNDIERHVSFDDLYNEKDCQDCAHLKNLDYTAYTKEVCKNSAYPYVHVDIEINYFEFWLALDPIRIPQKRNSYLLTDNAYRMFYSNERKIKRRKTRNKNLSFRAKTKSNTTSSRKRKNNQQPHVKQREYYNFFEKIENSEQFNVEEGGDEDVKEKKIEKKNKFREKIKYCKNMNMDNPYVLATKGCLKSVIFFLLYSEKKNDKRDEAKGVGVIEEQRNNTMLEKLANHWVSMNPQYLNNLENCNSMNNQDEKKKKLKCNLTEMLNYSNLNSVIDVHDLFKSSFMQWINYISSLLPCVVNMNIFLSQITSAISKPVARSPFLKAYIDWNNVQYNNILLQPCRANFSFEMKVPTSQTLIERFLGINKITSVKIARKHNIIYQNEVEGIDMKITFEPIVLNVDSNTLTLLNQLYNIIFDFYNYSSKFYCTKEKEEEEELLRRVILSGNPIYNNFPEFRINDSFYFNVHETSSYMHFSEYSVSSVELPSNESSVEEKINLCSKNNMNRLFVSFRLNSEGKVEKREKKDWERQEEQEETVAVAGSIKATEGDGTVGAVSANEDEFYGTAAMPHQTKRKRHKRKSEQKKDKKEEDKQSDERSLLPYNCEKDTVKNNNIYALDSNVVSILMLNLVENVRINCNVNFDVVTLQIWDSNTAYNRCSLNFVIEYFHMNFCTLNIYEQNLSSTNKELLNEKGNISFLKNRLNFNLNPDEGYDVNNVRRNSKEGGDAISNDKNSIFYKKKCQDLTLQDNSKISWNNKEKIVPNSEVSNFPHCSSHHNNSDKNSRYKYSKSAVDLSKNDHSVGQNVKQNLSMTKNINHVNRVVNVKIFNTDAKLVNDRRTQHFNDLPENNTSDSIRDNCETLNTLKKEKLRDESGKKRLWTFFNKEKFLKNIEQFNIEIKKIFKNLFFRRKIDVEDIEMEEGKVKHGNKLAMKKQENGNNIFLKNEYMFNDIKNYNENKVNKNIECKIKFLIYCENFNKKENSYQTFIEPICTEIIALKKDIESPIHLYYYFSWLNINWNFNFLDNILSLCCSVIFSMITQRTRLLLGRHMNDIDNRKNYKELIHAGKNEKIDKIDDSSSKYPNVNNNIIYQTEYDDNNTEKKGLSEMGDTHTSMYLPNRYGVMNDEQHKDLAIITNENILFRFNKFDVLNTVNRSLDTYIFGELILEKLLRNYQYSCQYPGDYIAKYENEFNVDKLHAPSEQLLHIKLFNYIKKKKRLEMNNICKINNLLGQPIAICTIHEKDVTNNDVENANLQRNSRVNRQSNLNKHDIFLHTVNTLSGRKFTRNGSRRYNVHLSRGSANGRKEKRERQNDGDVGGGIERKRDKKMEYYHHRHLERFNSEKLSKGENESAVNVEDTDSEKSDVYSEYRKSDEGTQSARNRRQGRNVYALDSDSSRSSGKHSIKYQWKIISNNESLDLPTYENGKVKFFLIRFRLLNYIYDIPSSILNTECENEDVIRLVMPERRLPPNINKQVEQDLYNEELLELDNKPSFHSNYHTIYPTNYYTPRKYIANKEDIWKPCNIPQPRNHLFIFFRTSSRISHEEKQEYDFFLSSIVAVKNNTDFPLYLFKSIPGNSNKSGIFKEYFFKYNIIPSPPPTYTLKIDKKIEKYIERKININNYANEKTNGINIKENQNNVENGNKKDHMKKVKRIKRIKRIQRRIHKQMLPGKNYEQTLNMHDIFTYNNSDSGDKLEEKTNSRKYTQNKSYLYGRKFIKNIFPLMKLSSIEHYISGDIKFSSLAPLKYKKKKKEKSKLKYELQKKLIKKKIKELYLKSMWKKTKHKYIGKYENGLPLDERHIQFAGHRNLRRNIMSINDSFFRFAKKSSSSISLKLSNGSANITDLSNITLSTLSSSFFSFDTHHSNSSLYDNSLYDYDKDNCEEQALLNEYFKKQSDKTKGLDVIEIANNSSKLIPIPLYWLVAENAFIWLSIQNENIYKTGLYEFLEGEEYNADYICTKGTLDNMLNYQSPFSADPLKQFKPYLIRLKNHLLIENEMLTKEQNKNTTNVLNNYNLNYINLKEVYFTSTIISVYNPNSVLHKKDAHNFYQINIEHALMINNGLPKTMYLNYELFNNKPKKYVKKSISAYTSFHSTDKSNTCKTSTKMDQSCSLGSLCVTESEDEASSPYRGDITQEDDVRRSALQKNNTLQQDGNNGEDKTVTCIESEGEGNNDSICNGAHMNGPTSSSDNFHIVDEKKEKSKVEQNSNENRGNGREKITHFVDRLYKNTWKEKKNTERVENKDRLCYNNSEESNGINDKQLLMKEINSDKNVFIYRNIKKENNVNKENIKRKSYLEESNFIVNIKKENNKDIYQIKINPGQSIKLPFVPHNVTISFDGYYSRNITINYPHKKGREKVILEKEVNDDVGSFFTFDYEEKEVSHSLSKYLSTSGSYSISYSEKGAREDDKCEEVKWRGDRCEEVNCDGLNRVNRKPICRRSEYPDSMAPSNVVSKDGMINMEDMNKVRWENDNSVLNKCAKYRTSKYEEYQRQLTIWAIFNEFYETGKNRYQDISLEKIHHGTYSVSCTFFVSACVINRLNYPIKLKRLNNDNVIVIEPYVRKLLPCEFSVRRNKIVISYDTLKEVKSWTNYPLKRYMIKRTKLGRTRNIIKKNKKIMLNGTTNKEKKCMQEDSFLKNHTILDVTKKKELNCSMEGNSRNGSTTPRMDITKNAEESKEKKELYKSNFFSRMKNRNGKCFLYRSNINKPLESEDFRITDLSITRLTCCNNNKNMPQLKYSVYMSIAPMPFFRTTVMEILPYIVIINNTKMNIVFQEFIKNYTYFRYNTLEPGAYVEFHPQSKKKVMLKICGIFQNSFNYLVDDYLQKELYLENLERENERLLDRLKQEDCADNDGDSKGKCGIKGGSEKDENAKGGNKSGSRGNIDKCDCTVNRGNYGIVTKNDSLSISQKLSVFFDIDKPSNMKRHTSSKNLSNSVKEGAPIREEGITNLSSFRGSNNVKNYKKIDELQFLHWSEVLDLTRVSMVYFRHPVVSNKCFKKEEKKLRKLNFLLRKNGKNDSTYMNISEELMKTNPVPYEYTCCSMEITTFKGCKFVRFQDIDVVPYYLINLTKYNIKLRQVGIYEHSEILQKIPKTFDEIFKNYAFNFSFYNPYKDPKLKISILFSNKRSDKNKKQKKKTNVKNRYVNLKYTNTLKINIKNEINYLNFLANNYVTANDEAKAINDKILHLKRFTEQIDNISDENVNIIDLGNCSNVTLLKLKQGDTAFIYILCTKRTYNGKTIFTFENYNDLIGIFLNSNNISFNNKHNYKLMKSFHLLSTKIKNTYLKKKNKEHTKRSKSKNSEDFKRKKDNQNIWYLLNLFKKKSVPCTLEGDTRISHIITDLYEKKIVNREEKKKKIIPNLNIFAHFIFKGLGLSINNHNLEEILYLSMEYILVVYKQISDRDMFHINIGWLQIDNHTKNSDYKNVLLPIVDAKAQGARTTTFPDDPHAADHYRRSSHGRIDRHARHDSYYRNNGYDESESSRERHYRCAEEIALCGRKSREDSNESFPYRSQDSNNFSKSDSQNMLHSFYTNRKMSYDSYFEKDDILISTNRNNPLYNSYRFFIPSFFYSEYNSILNTTIVKQKRGNMKNFLELSEVNIKISPLSINIDSYFIIEILKIFDELLKIVEYDLSNYNSLNLEKNIELRDTDFDCLEYKKNIGPLEELLKHHILRDYHLYERIANFKFSTIDDLGGKSGESNGKERSIEKGESNVNVRSGVNVGDIGNMRSSVNVGDIGKGDMPDLRAYITLMNEYKNLEQSSKNVKQSSKDRIIYPKEIYGRTKENGDMNNLERESDHFLTITNDVLLQTKDYSKERKIRMKSKRDSDVVQKREKEDKKNSINHEDMFNEEKMNYMHICEKYYKSLLNNRKRILKKIQNINLKNNLISFDKIFISKLEINEIKLIINIKNKSLSYSKKSEIMESNVMNALVVLIMNIPNISDAHLYFEKETKKNMCGSLYVLIFNEIMNDYINPGIDKMFNVLGAIDFIGNPLIIYKHWKKGYNTFINDLKKSIDSCSFPLLFCILLLNIIGRFGKSLLSGILEGVSRLCGSWSTCFERFSRNADNFSIVTNSNFLQNEILDQPSNCGEGIFYGCQSFLNILAISCVNTLYKPFIALKKSKCFRKNEKEKLKLFLSTFKVLSYGLFSGCSSLFFGFFNSIFSFFTFLFIGTLNQIQTLTMKSVVRPKKMSIIREYAKFVNYEYPLSFSNHVINEKKKKKELLKKNIIAVILLYTIKDNNPSNVKNFLWVSSKEVGYCEKDKLLWALYINWIIKVDVLLIRVDNGQVKGYTILNRSGRDGRKRRNYQEGDGQGGEGQDEIRGKIKTKWKLQNLFNPQNYRQFSDFKPSYYIRILYRSVYKVKKTHGRSKIKNFTLSRKHDANYKIKQILRKNTYEKYFEKEFKKEHMSYDQNDGNSKEEEKNIGCFNKKKNSVKHDVKRLKRVDTSKKERTEKESQCRRKHYHKREKYFSNGPRNCNPTNTPPKNEDLLIPYEEVGIRDESKRKKHTDHYQLKDANKASEECNKVHKIEQKKKNARKHHVHKKKYLYISKLVKCESKEVSLHAFSLLLSFLMHKSPYYLKTAN